MLPDGNGINLIEKFLEKKPDIKISLSSGYADEKSRLSTIQQKKYEFIQKPYALSRLLTTVHKLFKTK